MAQTWTHYVNCPEGSYDGSTAQSPEEREWARLNDAARPPEIVRRKGWLMPNGKLNFVAGWPGVDTPVEIVSEPEPGEIHLVVGYVVLRKEA